jgi:hypothetical protein
MLTAEQMDQVTAGAPGLAYPPGLTIAFLPTDPHAPGAIKVFGELPPNPELPPGLLVAIPQDPYFPPGIARDFSEPVDLGD